MTDYLNAVLLELVPRFEQERGDWERVVADARSSGERPVDRRGGAPVLSPWRIESGAGPTRWLSPRRLAIIAAIATAIAVPLVAVAASQEWWFLRFGAAPVPVTDVSVVRTGSWQGKAWQLVAYRSDTDGICFSLTPTPTANSAGEGAGMSCDQIEGVPRTAQSKPYMPHAITALSGGASNGFPAYIVGPVTGAADEVVIELLDGTILRTRTFDAPAELGSAIRFYARELPAQPSPTGERQRLPVRKLVGLSNDRRIVACLLVPAPEKGVPLSACR